MWYKFSQQNDFKDNIESLTPFFINAAQEIYNDWDENQDVYFGGGICHLIADAFVEIIYKNFPNYFATTFTRDDIQHVETIVYNIDTDNLEDVDDETDIETIMIDINPYLYENGGGFNWTKIPDVEFTNTDVTFYRTYTDKKYISQDY